MLQIFFVSRFHILELALCDAQQFGQVHFLRVLAEQMAVQHQFGGILLLVDEDERESREKDTMANLASLGILAAAFGHETLGWASSCAANAGWLERNLPQYFFFPNADVEAQVKVKLADTAIQARRIETFAEFSIGNVKPEKRKRTTFCLKKVVQNILKTFDQSLRVQRNITLDIEGNLPKGQRHIKGYPIDWESVLVNLITNAEWALRERKENYQRLIRVTLRAEGAMFLLTFDDNGIGIPAGQEERIFLPTVSSKRNASGYVVCKRRGEHISVFYVICPVLLITTLVVFLNLHDIVHAILHYEGQLDDRTTSFTE